MNRQLFLFLCAILLSAMRGADCYAASLTADQARAVAQQFVTSGRVMRAPLHGSNTLRLAHTAISPAGVPDYYVFNRGVRDGYVVVGGDDCAAPVWGYSTTGEFVADNIPDNKRWWLGEYQRQLEWLRSHSTTKPNRAQNLDTSVEPMLTSLWDQGAPYNNYCPQVRNGWNGRAATGCVATAMAQLMYYYKWPKVGKGSYNYVCYVDGGSRTTLSANFGQTAYDWSLMRDEYSGEYTTDEGNAVALLMSHAGISVDMQYGDKDAGGSPAYSEDVPPAFTNYFRYDQRVTHQYRDYFTGDWDAELRAELDAGRPLFYSGVGTMGGHAFVFDGYNSDGYFHVNWGWSGSDNDYFLSTLLAPESLGIGGGGGNFNYAQSAMLYLSPERLLLAGNVSPAAATMPASAAMATLRVTANAADFDGNVVVAVRSTNDNNGTILGRSVVHVTAAANATATVEASVSFAGTVGKKYYLVVLNPHFPDKDYNWGNAVAFTVAEEPEVVYAPGDINGDGNIDIDDLNALINIINEKQPRSNYPGQANVDGDNNDIVDIDDVNAEINLILQQ